MVQKNCVKPKIIVITGPTGVGKSAAAIEAAKSFDGEIIGADSMQIYKGLDIGTGKVTPKQREGVPHYMIDIVDPDREFSVGDYVSLASKDIEEIISKNKLPIIVGGTVFYINGLLGGFNFASAPKDEAIRERLKREGEEQGSEYLYGKLLAVDPTSARAISPKDVKRVIRALEIFYVTGKPKSEIAVTKACPYDFLLINLTDDRDKLYQRIESRVDGMVADGLVDEVKGFYGIKGCQSMQAIGYKEIIEYLDSAITLNEAIEKIKINSRHYAKRQMTFIRSLKFEKKDLYYRDYEGLFAEISVFCKKEKTK